MFGFPCWLFGFGVWVGPLGDLEVDGGSFFLLARLPFQLLLSPDPLSFGGFVRAKKGGGAGVALGRSAVV